MTMESIKNTDENCFDFYIDRSIDDHSSQCICVPLNPKTDIESIIHIVSLIKDKISEKYNKVFTGYWDVVSSNDGKKNCVFYYK